MTAFLYGDIMIKLCFVCHGNICRSPMAEFVMKELVRRAGREKEFHIVSRATHTDEIWNGVGSRIYPPAEAMLIKKHIPYDKEKRAVLLEADDYGKYDLFIGMDRENMRAMPRILKNDREGKILKLLDFADGGNVSDPWYTRDFERAFQDIYKGCEALLNVLTD